MNSDSDNNNQTNMQQIDTNSPKGLLNFVVADDVYFQDDDDYGMADFYYTPTASLYSSNQVTPNQQSSNDGTTPTLNQPVLNYQDSNQVAAFDSSLASGQGQGQTKIDMMAELQEKAEQPLMNRTSTNVLMSVNSMQ